MAQTLEEMEKLLECEIDLWQGILQKCTETQ